MISNINDLAKTVFTAQEKEKEEKQKQAEQQIKKKQSEIHIRNFLDEQEELQMQSEFADYDKTEFRTIRKLLYTHKDVVIDEYERIANRYSDDMDILKHLMELIYIF